MEVESDEDGEYIESNDIELRYDEEIVIVD